MSPTAQALVLHCIDYRFIHEIVHEMKRRGLDRAYDLVAVAGAAKNIVDPTEPHDRDFVLRQINLARNLHGINEVILINHVDCGAYKAAGLTDPEKEEERHRQDLVQAKKMIDQQFSGIQVTNLLANIESSGQVLFSEIP